MSQNLELWEKQRPKILAANLPRVSFSKNILLRYKKEQKLNHQLIGQFNLKLYTFSGNLSRIITKKPLNLAVNIFNLKSLIFPYPSPTTLNTSSTSVIPSKALSRPSCVMVNMPCATAVFLNSA